MSDLKSHLNDLSEIRHLMERNTRFLSLSGLSGISAGVCGLVGAWVAWSYLGGTLDLREMVYPGPGLTEFLLLDAGLTFLAALGLALFFSVRAAKKDGLPLWNSTARRMVLDLCIPLVAGAVFCLILLYQGAVIWVPACTLLFYGLALLNASRATLPEVRLLALSELALGLVCAAWSEYSLLFWGLGFGLLHIVYGTIMYLKYKR